MGPTPIHPTGLERLTAHSQVLIRSWALLNQVSLRATTTSTSATRFVPMSRGDRVREKKDHLRRDFVQWTHTTFWAPDVASSLIRAYGQEVPDGVIPLMHHNVQTVSKLGVQ
jgi:hypothetical protein